MKTCIIIAGGDFDISSVSAEKLKSEAELIICADRGLKYADEMGLVPDILIGDFDSYIDEVHFDGEIIRTVPEKDDTDTIMAVRLAISRGVRRIILYGALGGRFDHSIANIQTLLFASEQGC
ncbi:MAG: thiamine diphosphokinase, partial [Ruminococcus sp.]|nr:thiamine diphosphokinase [Ruminococcus sp.]